MNHKCVFCVQESLVGIPAFFIHDNRMQMTVRRAADEAQECMLKMEEK